VARALRRRRLAELKRKGSAPTATPASCSSARAGRGRHVQAPLVARWTEDALPPLWQRVILQSWDMRFGDSQEAASSYVVGQVWGVDGADRYLLGQIRAGSRSPTRQGGPRARRLRCRRRPPSSSRRRPTAPRSSTRCGTRSRPDPDRARGRQGGPRRRGRAVRRGGQRAAAGRATTSRARPATSRRHVEDFIEEHAVFPNGANDDQVDAMTQALNWLEHLWPSSNDTYAAMLNDAHVEGMYRGVMLPIRSYRLVPGPQRRATDVDRADQTDYNLPIGADGSIDQRRAPAGSSSTSTSRTRCAPPPTATTSSSRSSRSSRTARPTSTAAGSRTCASSRRARRGRSSEIRPARDGVPGLHQGPAARTRAPTTAASCRRRRDQARLAPRRLRLGPRGRQLAGRSMLRSCYRPWKLKDRVLRIGARTSPRAAASRTSRQHPARRRPDGGAPAARQLVPRRRGVRRRAALRRAAEVRDGRRRRRRRRLRAAAERGDGARLGADAHGARPDPDRQPRAGRDVRRSRRPRPARHRRLVCRHVQPPRHRGRRRDQRGPGHRVRAAAALQGDRQPRRRARRRLGQRPGRRGAAGRQPGGRDGQGRAGPPAPRPGRRAAQGARDRNHRWP
jgi:hypothetical protein